MDRSVATWVVECNVKQFQAQLDEGAVSGDEQRMLLRLLAQEKAKLREAHRSAL